MCSEDVFLDVTFRAFYKHLMTFVESSMNMSECCESEEKGESVSN